MEDLIKSGILKEGKSEKKSFSMSGVVRGIIFAFTISALIITIIAIYSFKAFPLFKSGLFIGLVLINVLVIIWPTRN